MIVDPWSLLAQAEEAQGSRHGGVGAGLDHDGQAAGLDVPARFPQHFVTGRGQAVRCRVGPACAQLVPRTRQADGALAGNPVRPGHAACRYSCTRGGCRRGARVFVFGHLPYPRGGRVRGGAQDPDTSAGVLDDRQHVRAGPGQGDRFQDVSSRQGIGLGAPEVGSGAAGPFGRRVDSGRLSQELPERPGRGASAIPCRDAPPSAVCAARPVAAGTAGPPGTHGRPSFRDDRRPREGRGLSDFRCGSLHHPHRSHQVGWVFRQAQGSSRSGQSSPRPAPSVPAASGTTDPSSSHRPDRAAASRPGRRSSRRGRWPQEGHPWRRCARGPTRSASPGCPRPVPPPGSGPAAWCSPGSAAARPGTAVRRPAGSGRAPTAGRTARTACPCSKRLPCAPARVHLGLANPRPHRLRRADA